MMEDQVTAAFGESSRASQSRFLDGPTTTPGESAQLLLPSYVVRANRSSGSRFMDKLLRSGAEGMPINAIPPVDVVIVIHADPQTFDIGASGKPNHPESEDELWAALKRAVDAASRNEHVLNIMMAKQWADVALADPWKVFDVAMWILAGHKIGWHHHDVTHGGTMNTERPRCALTRTEWIEAGQNGANYYTECGQYYTPALGISSLWRLKEEVKSLLWPEAVAGQFDFGTHGKSYEFREFNWQPGIWNSSGSAADDGDPGLNTPDDVYKTTVSWECREHYLPDRGIPELGAFALEVEDDIGKFRAEEFLADVEALLAAGLSNTNIVVKRNRPTVSFVFHAFSLPENTGTPGIAEQLFIDLAGLGVFGRPLSEVLEERLPRCAHGS